MFFFGAIAHCLTTHYLLFVMLVYESSHSVRCPTISSFVYVGFWGHQYKVCPLDFHVLLCCFYVHHTLCVHLVFTLFLSVFRVASQCDDHALASFYGVFHDSIKMFNHWFSRLFVV